MRAQGPQQEKQGTHAVVDIRDSALVFSSDDETRKRKGTGAESSSRIVKKANGSTLSSQGSGSKMPRTRRTKTALQPLGWQLVDGFRKALWGSGFLCVIVSAFGFSFSSLVVLLRSMVMLLFIDLALWHCRIPFWGQPKNRKLLVARALLGFSATQCIFYSLNKLPLADTEVLYFTNPIWGAMLAWALLREPWTLVDVLIARPQFLFGAAEAFGADRTHSELMGVAVALAGAVFAAAAYVVVRTIGTGEHSLVVAHYFALLSIPASLMGMFIQGNNQLPSLRDIPNIFTLGLCSAVSIFFVNRGLQLQSAASALAISYAEVPIAYISGILLLDEIPGVYGMAGAVAVACSTVVTALKGRSQPSLKESSSDPSLLLPARSSNNGVMPARGLARADAETQANRTLVPDQAPKSIRPR
eukprot:jgi/Chlat1/3290/Chrsp22S03538